MEKGDNSNQDDIDFLCSGLPEPKVSREVALSDFKRFLEDKNLIAKTKRKIQDDEDKEHFESAKETIINCIMDGTIYITEDPPLKIVQHLTNPPIDNSGTPLYETLEFQFVPDVIQLRKLDAFKENESMAKAQALMSAMTKKATKELGKISSSDLDVFSAVAFF